jgi:hypothetical protein
MLTKVVIAVIFFAIVLGAWWILGQRSSFDQRIAGYTSEIQMETSKAKAETRQVLDDSSLAELPKPARDYFHSVLPDSLPSYQLVHLTQEGSFNFGQNPQPVDSIAWKALTASQWVNTQKPAFIWDALISMAPGVSVRVIDQYLDGDGRLEARIWPGRQCRSNPSTGRG